MKRSLTVLVAVTLAMGLIASTAIAAGTVVVSPTSPGNWRANVGGGGIADLAPAPTPLGTGSAHFDLPTPADFALIRTTDYDGVELADLTTLTYSTYVDQNQNCQAPYISLNLDSDGIGGTVDDQLQFEPCYQTNGYQQGPPPLVVPDQCDDTDANCFPKDEWVDWDAMLGAWWAASEQGPDIVLTTLALYLNEHPNATIVGRTINSYQATVQQPINTANTSNWNSKSKGAIPVMFKLELSSGVFGGFRIATGNGWSNHFIGYADALTVGVLGDNTTYNFEGVGSLPNAVGAFAPTCNLPEATIEISKNAVVATGDINEVAVQSSLADDGNAFRVVDCKYQYILSIPSLQGTGTYEVQIWIDGVRVPTPSSPGGQVKFDIK